MIYLFAGFGAIWLLLFMYAFWMARRIKQLQEEVRLLKRNLKLDA